MIYFAKLLKIIKLTNFFLCIRKIVVSLQKFWSCRKPYRVGVN